MIRNVGLLLLAVISLGIAPVGRVDVHAQGKKVNGYWRRAADRDSEVFATTVQQTSAAWEISTCLLARTPATLKAIDDLIDVGIPFVESQTNCSQQTDLAWLFTTNSKDKNVVDDTSHIRLVFSANDSAYPYFATGDVVAATVRMTSDSFTGGNFIGGSYMGGTAVRASRWDIIVNEKDYNFLPGLPSQNYDVAPPVEKFQYDVTYSSWTHARAWRR